MKKLISILTLVIMLGNSAIAACDFATGIKQVDGGFLYTSECHQRVGKMVKDLDDREAEVGKLTKALELKDLALTAQERRADLWMNTSMKLEDKLNTIERYSTTTQWIYYGLGILTMGVAVWGAGQLR